MSLCALQENCEHYVADTQCTPHGVRAKVPCFLFKDNGCIDQHDIKQGPACSIRKWGKK